MENEIQVSRMPSDLIAMALDKQADPNVLSKLMDLQERWGAQQARKAFVLAMTAFKQEAPAVLKKNDRVDFTTQKGRTVYNYANLGSIVQEMTALLGKHKLSAAWETSQNEKGMIKVSCHITHSEGHRETVTLEGPPDQSGNKNAIQAIGSAVTYLQRYTLLAALGLATTEDDDGRGGKDEPDTTHAKPLDSQASHDTKRQDGQEGHQNQKQGVEQGGNTVTLTVDNVEHKVGETKGKKWVIHTVVSGKDRYGTFDDKFADLAQWAKEVGIPCTITWEDSPKGKKIVSLVAEELPEPGEDG